MRRPSKKIPEDSPLDQLGLGDQNTEELVLQQIVAAPFTSAGIQSYSVLGLSNDGKVYRYDPKCLGWVPWSMTVAGCRDKHKAKR